MQPILASRNCRSLVSALGGIVLLAAANCGGGDDKKFSSGVDSSKPVNTLTDAENQKVCMAFDKWAEDWGADAIGCQFSAVLFTSLTGAQAATDAELQMSCKATYDTCIKNESTGADGGASTETCEKPDPNCTATVGEIEKCLNDTKETYDAFAKKVPTCASLTKANLPQASAAVQPPERAASCNVLEQKCPGMDVPGGDMPGIPDGP